MSLLSRIYNQISKYKSATNLIRKSYFHHSKCLLEKEEDFNDLIFQPMQKEKSKNVRKVTVIGAAGQVGTIFSYLLYLKNVCDTIVMVEHPKKEKKVCGEALDLSHALGLGEFPILKISCDAKHTENSDVIVITSGITNKIGQSRLDIAQPNADHLKEIIPQFVKVSPDAVLLVITDPVDIMTYLAWKYSGLPKNQVLGIGTEMDTYRFRYFLSKRLGISPVSTYGWIIGEHGDSSVPVWSSVNVAGTKLRDIDPKIGTPDDKNCWDEIIKNTQVSEHLIKKLKGASGWAVAMPTLEIVDAILHDRRTVHTISTSAKGFHGVDVDCFLSLPCVIGNRGVFETIKQVLTDEEVKLLNESACVLYKVLEKLKK